MLQEATRTFQQIGKDERRSSRLMMTASFFPPPAGCVRLPFAGASSNRAANAVLIVQKAGGGAKQKTKPAEENERDGAQWPCLFKNGETLG